MRVEMRSRNFFKFAEFHASFLYNTMRALLPFPEFTVASSIIVSPPHARHLPALGLVLGAVPLKFNCYGIRNDTCSKFIQHSSIPLPSCADENIAGIANVEPALVRGFIYSEPYFNEVSDQCYASKKTLEHLQSFCRLFEML
jgi:hypothetical protein